MEKMVKVRKHNVCDSCHEIINIGEMALYGEGRNLKYDDNEREQIGIEYYKYYICQKCLNSPDVDEQP